MFRFYSVIGLCALAIAIPLDAIHAKALKEKVLYSFNGTGDGDAPLGGLIADDAGNFYGTSSGGGDPTCTGGCGTVFKLASDGAFSVLHTFKGGADGVSPLSNLIADAVGNLYGTTYGGGTSNYGTVFKLAPDGTFTVLHSFKGGKDGAYLRAGVIADKNGNLYGTTQNGGKFGSGIVFKLAPNGKKTVLHDFHYSDGAYPEAGLVADAAGNLYGTTNLGGKKDAGTVFKIAPNGDEAVLYSFTGHEDGGNLVAGVIVDGAGNLYGTTENGGSGGTCDSGCGTVFRLAPDGTETVLYNFEGDVDGGFPSAALIADGAGNLYGTTEAGGSANFGTVFKVGPNGKETVLYSFRGGADGSLPRGALIADGLGNFYGVTEKGGEVGFDGFGTVFETSAKKKN